MTTHDLAITNTEGDAAATVTITALRAEGATHLADWSRDLLEQEFGDRVTSVHEAESGVGIYAAKTTLAGLPGVVAADVVDQPNLLTGGEDRHLEVVLTPEHDRVPPRVVRILAECGLGIDDVSRQGSPSHVVVTAGGGADG